MSFNVPASFQVKFKNNIEMVMQQQQSALIGAVATGDDASAEKVKIKDLVGNNAPKSAGTRHGSTQWGNRSYDGVWVAKKPELYDADLVDNADRLQTMISLDGTATAAAAGTIARAHDVRILEGFYGSVISGKEGTTLNPFPSANILPATLGGAAGAQKMNTTKLIEANAMLGRNFVDKMAKKWIVLTEDDNKQLMSEVQATNGDYRVAFGAVVEDGYVRRILGWNVLHLELDNPLLVGDEGAPPIADLATDASGYRKTPFWVQGGLYANFWQRLRTKVGEIPEKLWSTGYLAGTTLSATRTQPGMSGIILNQKG